MHRPSASVAAIAAALALVGGIATARAEESAEPLGYAADRHRPIIIVYPVCPGPGVPLPTPPATPSAPAPLPPGVVFQACPQLAARAPAQVIQYALANPHAIRGYGERRNPNVPYSPFNPYRTWLTLQDMGKPWNKCNTVVWKAGCP
jgi:hypothetical protein